MPNRQKLHDRVGAALVGMIRRVEESQETAARLQGMHPTDFRCMGYLLGRNEPVSPRDIISYLAITSGAGTALLDRMEKSGFVRRVPNPDDRRSVLIVLDETAAAGPIAVHRQISADYERVLADLSDENLEAIALYLERVKRVSEAMDQALYLQQERTNPIPEQQHTQAEASK